MIDPYAWYDRPGPFITAWLPTPSATEEAEELLRLAWRNARGQVADGPEAAVAAIDAALGERRAHAGGDSVHIVASADGHTELVHLADEVAEGWAVVDALPRLSPLLVASQRAIAHVVVIADRVGADIVAICEAGEEHEHVVEGETLHIQRSHPGGWSQRRFQQRAENTWERNAAGVAEEVDAIRRDVQARIVVVAGDPRAVGFLTEHASSELAGALVHLEGAGRNDADPFGELAPEVDRLVADMAAQDTVAVLDRFHEARQTGNGADGPQRALAALREARVSLLAVHDDPDDDRRAAVDLASAQVALHDHELTDLGLRAVDARLVDTAVFAAHRTGAEVHFVPRSGPKAPEGGIGAVLRGR